MTAANEVIPMDEVVAALHAFANKHGIVLTQKGECGFGRPCVGFLHGDNYVDHNPIARDDNYMPIPEFADDRLYAPEGVEAYHKHDCLAVLAHGEDYDAALRQLLDWVKHLEALGEVEVVQYKTGATGLQVVLSGAFGRTVRIKKDEAQ